MKNGTMILLGVCLLVLTTNAYPMIHHGKGFRPPIMPVPVHPYPYPMHPYPMYGPGPSRGFGDGLTLLSSAALLGTGNPGFQALGGLGLLSLG